MTSSYTANSGLEKPDTGDQDGAWGGTLNTNFDIIDRVLSGVGSVSLSGTTHTLTTTDGTLTDGMYRVLLFTGALGANNTITISPNDQDKLYFIVNNTTDSGSSGPYSVIIKQGTGDTVTIENGRVDIVYADGAGSGADVISLGTTLGQKAFDLYTYTATAGQTTFTGSDTASKTLAYSVGNLFVTLNGLTLINGTDYTASNTTSVVFTDAATVSDELNIYAFNTFSISAQTLTLFKYSATTGQTTFSGSDSASQTLAYTAGMIIVTLNGVVLDTSDFTASNGTSIVLGNAASLSDEFNVYAFAPFNVSNVTTASADFAIGDDLSFTSDAAIINMGADSDVTITHVHDSGITLASGTNDTTLQVNSNAADAGIAPIVILNRTSDSPADNDYGGEVRYNMENDNNQQFTAGAVTARATDVSDGNEDAKIILQSMVAGTLTTGLEIVGGKIGSSAYSPAGSIVQVVQNTTVGQSTTSSTSAVDITNFTVNITPASASNYVIVMISCLQQYTLVASTNVAYWHKFIGGNLGVTDKLIAGQPWAGLTIASGSGGLQGTGSYAWIGMDNPETTSAVTYHVEHYVTSASSTAYAYYGQLVCMEVQV